MVLNSFSSQVPNNKRRGIMIAPSAFRWPPTHGIVGPLNIYIQKEGRSLVHGSLHRLPKCHNASVAL